MNLFAGPIPALAALCLIAIPALRAAEPRSPLEGIWKTDGYGYLVEILGDKVRFFEDSKVTCIASMTGRIQNGRLALDAGSLGKFTGSVSREGETLHIIIDETMTRRAHRLPNFPADAKTRMVERSTDPALVFDALWTAFDEHYAFFPERKIDWLARRAEFRPRALAAKDDQDLFTLFKELLSPLNDGHVNLYAGMREKWQWECGQKPAWRREAQTFVETMKANYLSGPLERRANRKLVSAKLRNGAAYLAIMGMEGFGDSFEQGTDALEAALDAAFTDLSEAPALILDLRFNGGGQDAYALRIAARFTSERRLAWTRRARAGMGWTETESFFIDPSPRLRWTKPVYLLTSGLTASAAENCAQVLTTLPHVTSLGERTAGIFSDMLSRKLPNGWVVTLSNEVYRDSQGRCSEALGITPRIAAPMDLAAAKTGRDPALDAVLNLMEVGKASTLAAPKP